MGLEYTDFVYTPRPIEILRRVDFFDIFDINSVLKNTQLNLLMKPLFFVSCVICLLIYYVISSAIIDVTISFTLLFVVVKLYLCLLIDLFILFVCCVLIKIQPASFHQRKGTLKQLKSSETNPLKDSSKIAKM